MNRQCSLGWHDDCSDPFGESCECECHPWLLRTELEVVVEYLKEQGAEVQETAYQRPAPWHHWVLLAPKKGSYLVFPLGVTKEETLVSDDRCKCGHWAMDHSEVGCEDCMCERFVWLGVSKSEHRGEATTWNESVTNDRIPRTPYGVEPGAKLELPDRSERFDPAAPGSPHRSPWPRLRRRWYSQYQAPPRNRAFVGVSSVWWFR
jgi:hypothetical protein